MQTQAEQFLAISNMFKLGCLPTQQQHPHTIGLSSLAKSDLPNAINRIKDLDIQVLEVLKGKKQQLAELYQEVNDTLQTKGRIYICGCGATGRLSLVLETLWRQQCRFLEIKQYLQSVVSFMAGGDAALIKSIEDFEDHPQFAEQQLIELGFSENDLLIGSTQGGQTPWVIGAVWKATTLSKRKPYILYGNPDEILIANVQRSKRFIQSNLIKKINMNVGHMAITGSTRMQSTTILMYGIGLSLLGCDSFRIKRKNNSWIQYFSDNLTTFTNYLKNTDFTPIQQLTLYESQLYTKKQQVSYLTNSYYSISILTDTTQRAPTFSLFPFQNLKQPSGTCWCNMILDSKNQSVNNEQRIEMDWKQMLGDRPIRSLESEYWSKYEKKVSKWKILGYPLHIDKKNIIQISHPLCFKTTSGLEIKLPQYPSNCRLSHHILLKILINNHSTLLMGRMGRYQSNVMTYVRASNYKLIDRAARCIMMLKKDLTYAQVIHKIYEIKSKISEDEPIVLKVIEALNNHK